MKTIKCVSVSVCALECTRRGGIPEDHHAEQLPAYCRVRFQAGQRERPAQGHSSAQSQHHVSRVEAHHVSSRAYMHMIPLLF